MIARATLSRAEEAGFRQAAAVRYVNREGVMAIQPTFRYATRFAEGLAAIRIGDTDEMGFIDKLGRLVIPSIRCVLALPFNGGLARIQGQDDRTGYIDVTGRFVWPLQ